MDTTLLRQLTSEVISLIMVTSVLTVLFGSIAGSFYSSRYSTYSERFWRRLPMASCIGCVCAFISKLMRKEIIRGQMIIFWQALSSNGWWYTIIIFISVLLVTYNFTKWLARLKGYGGKYHITRYKARHDETIAKELSQSSLRLKNTSCGLLDEDGLATEKSILSGKEGTGTEIDYAKFFRKIKQLATDFQAGFAGQYRMETGQPTQGEAYGQVMYRMFIAYYAILLDAGIKERYFDTERYKAERHKLMDAFVLYGDISSRVAENYLTKESARKMLTEVFDDLRKQEDEIPSSIYLKIADAELDDVLRH